MISRVAESCFWLIRYLERAESLSRLLHVNLAFQLDVALPDAERWRPLVVVAGEEARFAERTPKGRSDDSEAVQDFLTWDAENPSSLYSSLQWARENARMVRETISLEMWETVNELWLWLNRRSARNLYERNRHEFYVRIRDTCLLFQGCAQNTMLHQEAYTFMQLGRSLERANQTARTLDVKYHSLGPTRPGIEMPDEAAQWLAVLRSCAAIEPFFKSRGHTLSGAAVAEFLLLEPDFPRSVRFNLDWAGRVLERILALGQDGAEERRVLMALVGWVAQLSPEALLRLTIHAVLERIVDEIANVCAAVERAHFRSRPAARPSAQAAPASPQPAPPGAPREPPEEGNRLLSVVHRTLYTYSAPVSRSSHVFRLRPEDDARQHVLEHSLEVSVPGHTHEYEDVFGNLVTSLEVESPFDQLEIVARSLVRTDADAEPIPKHRRMQIPLVWMPWQRQMMNPYLLPPELEEIELRQLSDFAMSFVERNRFELFETLEALNAGIHGGFEYVPGSTAIGTTPYEVFRTRRGVCQDFANLLICLARLLGIPARYRVGYVYTGADYSTGAPVDASHAWAELYLPWVGWRGFDPTHGAMVARDYVRLASGRNYIDATPTSGTILEGGGDESLAVHVEVARVPAPGPGAP